MAALPAVAVCKLSRSWRFGPALSLLASQLLSGHREQVSIQGNLARNTTVYEVAALPFLRACMSTGERREEGGEGGTEEGGREGWSHAPSAEKRAKRERRVVGDRPPHLTRVRRIHNSAIGRRKSYGSDSLLSGCADPFMPDVHGMLGGDDDR